MFTHSKILAAFALVATTATGSAFADTYQHIDQLALRIDRQVKTLVSETRHYRHTPEYRHLLSDAQDMCALADHIHEIAHHHGDVRHLESDVAKLDAEFHHLQSVVNRIERDAAHGHGHIHGRTGHVHRLLCAIEEDIHHLQDDLRTLRTAHHRVRVHRPSHYAPSPSSTWRYNYGGYGQHGSWFGAQGPYGVPGYGSYGRGITIGGGSSRFTLRF